MSTSLPHLVFAAHTTAAGDLNWVDSEGKTIVYNAGDIAWTLASTALVWAMIPGVGFFYSGLLRRKNALSMIWSSMVSIAVVSFQVRRALHFPQKVDSVILFPVVLLGLFFDLQRNRQQIHRRPEYLLPHRALLFSHHRPLEYFGLKGVLTQPSIGSTRIPSIVFCVYQLMFAAITYVLSPFQHTVGRI